MEKENVFCGKKLTAERKKIGLNQSQLAEKLNISQKSISKYETGERRPSYETLVAMAALFNVSTDYFLGDSSPGENAPVNSFFFFFFDEELKKTFCERLNAVINFRGLNKADLIKDIEFSEEYIDLYLSGEQEPSLEHLVNLSKALNVQTDYLLGLSNNPSSRSRELINVFEQLNEDDQDIIIGKAKEYLKIQSQYESVAADQEALGKPSPSSGTGGHTESNEKEKPA